NFRAFGNPDILSSLLIYFRVKSFSEFYYKFADLRQSLPRVFNAFKQGLCYSFAVIIKIFSK
ncbi:MAG: DUF565 domain-containing protein, partial [Ruminococcus sp.]|nr:DUF565 domain-containing protein [Ruminococcus sp.]